MVERHVANVKVAGSTPVSCSNDIRHLANLLGAFFISLQNNYKMDSNCLSELDFYHIGIDPKRNDITLTSQEGL